MHTEYTYKGTASRLSSIVKSTTVNWTTMEAQFRFRGLQLAVLLIVALTQFPILTRSESVAPLQIVDAERRVSTLCRLIVYVLIRI